MERVLLYDFFAFFLTSRLGDVHAINTGYYMAEVCLYVILALGYPYLPEGLYGYPAPIYTHYHNSNLIWRTVSRRVDEVIPSDHPRRVASRVIQWYGHIHETWYCTPDQVTIMIICFLYAFFLTFFLILKPVLVFDPEKLRERLP